MGNCLSNKCCDYNAVSGRGGDRSGFSFLSFGGGGGVGSRGRGDLHGSTFTHYSLTSETSILDLYPTLGYNDLPHQADRSNCTVCDMDWNPPPVAAYSSQRDQVELMEVRHTEAVRAEGGPSFFAGQPTTRRGYSSLSSDSGADPHMHDDHCNGVAAAVAESSFKSPSSRFKLLYPGRKKPPEEQQCNKPGKVRTDNRQTTEDDLDEDGGLEEINLLDDSSDNAVSQTPIL